MKSEFDTFDRVFKPVGSDENLIKSLTMRKKDFIIRKTKYYTSIIYDNQEIIYRSKDKDYQFPINQMFLFNMVRKDAMKFLEENPNFEIPNKLPTNSTNLQYDNSYGEITGTDIDSAYWTIAYKIGIISERTYNKANEINAKVTKLASLAILGRTKAYFRYEKGEKIKEPILIYPKNEKLKDLYRAIRYNCYFIMGELAQILGSDFEAYRTDCIYYRDTRENRAIVHGFLDDNGFTYKQLVYED